MKKLLTVLMMTVPAFGAVMPFPADAAALDPVLHDASWGDYVERSIELDKAPGHAAAAVSGSEVGFRNWGFADRKAQIPMTEDTPVHIGSCSKAFAALSVLLLQEEGRLSVGDSISDYIPRRHVTYNGQDAGNMQTTKQWPCSRKMRS